VGRTVYKRTQITDLLFTVRLEMKGGGDYLTKLRTRTSVNTTHYNTEYQRSFYFQGNSDIRLTKMNVRRMQFTLVFIDLLFKYANIS
jgi:hypothetical protein